MTFMPDFRGAHTGCAASGVCARVIPTSGALRVKYARARVRGPYGKRALIQLAVKSNRFFTEFS